MDEFTLPRLHPITAANAARIQEIMQIGIGHAREVAYSPDGKYLAVGTCMGIWLYDAKTLSRLRLIGQHESGQHITFSNDGRLVASYDGRNQVAVWHVETGDKTSSFNHVGNHIFWMRISFHPSHNLIASADQHAIQIWNTQTGQIHTTIPITCGEVYFSPDGRKLVIAKERKFSIWDIDTATIREVPLTIPHPNTSCYVLGFDAEGKLIYGIEQTIVFWDMYKNVEYKHIDMSDPRRSGFRLEAGGTLFTFTQENSHIGVFNLNSGAERLIDTQGQKISSVSLNQDGLHIAFVDRNIRNGVEIVNLETEAKQIIHNDSGRGSCLAISPDSNLLAYEERENVIRILNLSDPTQSIHLDKQAMNLHDAYNTFTFDPTGSLLVFTSQGDAEGIYTWDIQSHEIQFWDDNDYWRYKSSKIEFSPDGRLLVVAEYDFYLWDKNKVQASVPESVLSDRVTNGIAFSGNGKLLAVPGYIDVRGERKEGIRILDSQSFELISTCTARPHNHLALNHDGTLLAGGDYGQNCAEAWLHDVETDEPLLSFQTCFFHSSAIEHVKFSPDGTVVAYGDMNGDIFLYDAQKRSQITVLRNPCLLASMKFSPDGRYIATISKHDDRVTLWGVSAE